MSSEVSPSYCYIVRSPAVRGGHALVEGTRIRTRRARPVAERRDVDSVTVSGLPTLTKSQVYECLAYYEDHRGEIDLLVARQMAGTHDQR
jgi:uncharacterized protein (DUF433 family)